MQRPGRDPPLPSACFEGRRLARRLARCNEQVQEGSLAADQPAEEPLRAGATTQRHLLLAIYRRSRPSDRAPPARPSRCNTGHAHGLRRSYRRVVPPTRATTATRRRSSTSWRCWHAMRRRARPVCGPKGFMDAVLGAARAAGWPETQLHYESSVPRWGRRPATVPSRSCCSSSGRVIPVAADQTVVQALTPPACWCPRPEQGVCGTCLTRVLEGECDHKGYVPRRGTGRSRPVPALLLRAPSRRGWCWTSDPCCHARQNHHDLQETNDDRTHHAPFPRRPRRQLCA